MQRNILHLTLMAFNALNIRCLCSVGYSENYLHYCLHAPVAAARNNGIGGADFQSV